MANNRVLPDDVADKIRIEFTPAELEKARREAQSEIEAERQQRVCGFEGFPDHIMDEAKVIHRTLSKLRRN
jgi:hypothetical protein